MASISDSIHGGVSAVQSFGSIRDRLLGFWVDDPNHPGVSAFVCQGRLTHLIIPQSYMGLRREELEAVINAVIINAHLDASPAIRARGAA